MNPDLGKIDEPEPGSVLIENANGHTWYREITDGYWYCLCEDAGDNPWEWTEVVEDVGPTNNSYQIRSGL